MVKKDQKWEWMERQEKAFMELKERFTKELVLAALDLDKKNEDGSGCIRLYYRGNVVNGVRRWKVEASGISFKISKQDREKL